MDNLKAFLLLIGSNPIFRWVVKVVRDSGLSYYAANSFAPTKAWMVGLGMAVASGLVHGFEVWIQQQAANSSQNSPNSSPLVMLKKRLTLALLFGFALSVASASAYEWTVPSAHIKPNTKKLSAIPSGLDEDDIVGIPTAALAVGTVSTSYGLSVSYSALWCHVKGDPGGNTSTLTSRFGLGASAYADMGDWLGSNFVTAPRLKAGVGVILPQMCGITPGVMEVWDLGNGSRSTVVTMNVPLNLLNSVIVKVCKL